MAKILDVETCRSAAEVGGWQNKSKMGISVAVVYDTVDRGYHFYTEDQAPKLCQELLSTDLVVGYNLIGFDYDVLQPHSIFSLKETPTLDLLVKVEKAAGKRLSLDNVCEHTLGIHKASDGLEALQWYKQGQISKIAQYCAFDVKATRLLAEFGATYGCVRYSDKQSGKILTVPVDWKIPWAAETTPLVPAPARIPAMTPLAGYRPGLLSGYTFPGSTSRAVDHSIAGR